MAQVIITSEDKQFGNLVQTGLTQKYSADVMIRPDVTDTISMIEMFSDTEIVICQEQFAAKLCDYFIKNDELFSTKVKLVVLGKVESTYPHITAIPKTAPYQKVILQVAFLLNKEKAAPDFSEPPPPVAPPAPVPMASIAEEDDDNDNRDNEKTTVFRMPLLDKKPPPVEKPTTTEPPEEYSSISMKYFLEIPELQLDFELFTRVKKQDDFEYNCKFASGTKITRTEIDRLLVRGGRELFVKKAEYKKANELFNGYYLNRFKATNLDNDGKLQLASDSYEILLDVFKNSSMDKYNVEIIKELIKLMDFLVKLPNPLTSFLNGMRYKKISYGFAHSFLGCLIIFQILDKFTWSKDQSKNKILYLALFHDLSLHNDRLIKLHHHFFEEQAKLSDEDKKIILEHADASATILETIVKAPKELTSIIREHHGIRSGKGIPDSLSLGVTPLSMGFIVVEHFVTKYLALWEKLNKDTTIEVPKDQLEAIFTEMKTKYPKLTYADMTVELEKYFKAR